MFGFPSLRHVQGSSIRRWMSNFGTCQSRLSIQLNITLATVSSLPQVNVCVCVLARGGWGGGGGGGVWLMTIIILMLCIFMSVIVKCTLLGLTWERLLYYYHIFPRLFIFCSKLTDYEEVWNVWSDCYLLRQYPPNPGFSASLSQLWAAS